MSSLFDYIYYYVSCYSIITECPFTLGFIFFNEHLAIDHIYVYFRESVNNAVWLELWLYYVLVGESRY